MARALKWFLFYRLVVAILGLGAIIIYHLSFSPLSVKLFGFPPHILAAYVILVFACLVNIIYLLLIQYVPPGNERKQALLQISVDVLLVTGLSYFTGGSGSIFVTFYFVLILAANIMGSPKIGLFYASASSILLATITILYSVSAAGGFTLPLLSPDYVKTSAKGFRFILPYLFFFGLILHFVAYSTGRLLSELAHERRLKAEMAERANLLESLREMSIGMAHEIRNPLASIKGAVQGLITVGQADAADNKKLLNIVLSESDRLNKIVSDFIEFANDRPLLQQ
ncbi:MAG: hypothetical protein HY762_02700, partial [Planctomycetes bacterium]|nr:hypothetical protein [Planctomycetota bacterium]